MPAARKRARREPAGSFPRLEGMIDTQDVWLVANPSSGSNDDDALEALSHHCQSAGLCLTRRIAFPEENLPTPAELDAAGLTLIAVFAGDGTINALVDALEGWSGAVLVLPGGTMNLLSLRLHGPRSSEEIVQSVVRGDARRVRLSAVRCDDHIALAGLLVGPATAWGDVREAMRELKLASVVEETVAAMNESTDGVPVRCTDPVAGRAEGYPLLMVTPERGDFSIKAYHAEGMVEYAKQGLAILRRNFRDGPHDDLGNYTTMRIESADGTDIPLLVDGEAVESGASVNLALDECGVDLIATGEG